MAACAPVEEKPQEEDQGTLYVAMSYNIRTIATDSNPHTWPERMPKVARTLGRSMRAFRKSMNEATKELREVSDEFKTVTDELAGAQKMVKDAIKDVADDIEESLDETEKAVKEKTVVIYKGHEYYVDHIQTYYDKGFKHALFLVPVDGMNSATVARMADCEVEG